MKRILLPAVTGIVLITMFVLLGSCSSVPGGKTYDAGKATGKKLPSWVETPPGPTEDAVYFVGSGTVTGISDNSTSEAEQKAIRSLIESVIRYAGIQVNDQTTIKARDTLNKYVSRLREKIESSFFEPISEAGESAAVRIVDRFTQKDGEEVSVFFLAEYDSEVLQREQETLWKVFFEHEDAVSKIEKKANALYNEGNYYQAATAYIEAAGKAYSFSIDKSDLVVRTNIRNAIESIEKISLATENNNVITKVGIPFQKPFLIKVTDGSNQERSGLAGVPFVVTYHAMDADGGTQEVRKSIQTSEEGIAAFYRPAPWFVGSDTLTMRIDLSMELEPLNSVPDNLAGEVSALAEAVRSKEATFRYTSISRAKEIPTGIVIVETDRAGNPRAGNDAASGVMEQLSDAGFSVEMFSPSVLDLQRLSHEQIVRRAKEQFSGRIERLIYGVFGISNFSDTSSMYTVEVTGSVKAVDLKTGRIVYSGASSKRSRGSNIRTAISVAFKGLGQELGEEMVEELP